MHLLYTFILFLMVQLNLKCYTTAKQTGFEIGQNKNSNVLMVHMYIQTYISIYM